MRRLEELKLVRPGAWEWFESNGKITDDQEREVLGERLAPDDRAADAKGVVGARLALLAAAAWRQELLSEGQLAELLKIGRVELRRILQDTDMEGSNGDDAPELLA